MDTVRVAQRSQRALESARRQARQRGNDAVTPEHLLLAILEDGAPSVGPGVVTGLLALLHVGKDTLVQNLLTATDADPRRGEGAALSFSAETVAVLERASSEARALGHNYVGAEHLLLGVLKGESRAARILVENGVTLEAAQAGIRRLLQDDA